MKLLSTDCIQHVPRCERVVLLYLYNIPLNETSRDTLSQHKIYMLIPLPYTVGTLTMAQPWHTLQSSR
jgi:hypothetical protein